ncbi:MAG: arylesterase [Gammaproteobacteria bacterium]|nr:arylesterase [Gammaproteobacteria bacterium]
MVAAPAFAMDSDPARARTVLVVGDSISAAYGIQRSEGWVALLEARLLALNPRHRVVNASVSGDTTGGGLTRLPDALALHSPDIVVIELGGNDALRGYPIDRIRGNLDRMAALCIEAGAKVIIAGMQIPPNYGSRYTTGFHASFAEVAERRDAVLIPFLLEGIATEADLMQQDGIHPTAAAQSRILDNLWPALVPLV